jgi:hypothetical protein
MGFWSSLKKIVKKAVRIVKAVFRLVLKIIVGLIMRVIHSVGEIFFFWTEKTMTLHVVILRDETSAAIIQPADIDSAIQSAKKIFKSKFNVAIKAYGKPMVQTLKGSAPKAALDVDCDGSAFGEEFGEAGDYFAQHTGGWVGIPISLAFPVTVFVVRSIKGKIGCSIPITDYVTLSAMPATQGSSLTGVSNATTLAHELAHTCLLAHREDKNNLLFPDASRGTDVTWWQKRVARTSRHCTFW